MDIYTDTLEVIIQNCTDLKRDKVGKILLLYNEPDFAIGDSYIRLGGLGTISSYFNNRLVDINLANRKYAGVYNGLLKNNPYVDQVLFLDWDQLKLTNYDVLFFGGPDEALFMDFLNKNYGNEIRDGSWKINVFSFSDSILQPGQGGGHVFPTNEQVNEYRKMHWRQAKPNELYLLKEEKEWANDWLRSRGMLEGEKLYIFLDSTSRREKMLNMNVYFNFLKTILRRQNIRVLVFDEKKIGKKEFYSEWLGNNDMKKMIFSEALDFREDLCLLGSDFTSFIFGPCTGLMHCASGIYNNYISSGRTDRQAPLMVTYTGQYIHLEKCANVWWGNSPLVNCLMLKKRNGGTERVLLKDLSDEEKELNDSLPCSAYTAEMLTDLINEKLLP